MKRIRDIYAVGKVNDLQIRLGFINLQVEEAEKEIRYIVESIKRLKHEVKEYEEEVKKLFEVAIELEKENQERLEIENKKKLVRKSFERGDNNEKNFGNDLL